MRGGGREKGTGKRSSRRRGGGPERGDGEQQQQQQQQPGLTLRMPMPSASDLRAYLHRICSLSSGLVFRHPLRLVFMRP